MLEESHIGSMGIIVYLPIRILRFILSVIPEEKHGTLKPLFLQFCVFLVESTPKNVQPKKCGREEHGFGCLRKTMKGARL